jgi:hypothetical protein
VFEQALVDTVGRCVNGLDENHELRASVQQRLRCSSQLLDGIWRCQRPSLCCNVWRRSRHPLPRPRRQPRALVRAARSRCECSEMEVDLLHGAMYNYGTGRHVGRSTRPAGTAHTRQDVLRVHQAGSHWGGGEILRAVPHHLLLQRGMPDGPLAPAQEGMRGTAAIDCAWKPR